MDGIIGYDELFDFQDDSQLQKALADIQKLSTEYDKASKSIKIAIQQVKTANGSMADTLIAANEKLSTQTEASRKQIVENAKATDTLVKSNQKLKKSEEDVAKADAEFAQRLMELTLNMTEAEKHTASLNVKIQDLTNTQKEAKKQLDQNKISQEQYQQLIVKSKAEQEKYKKELADSKAALKELDSQTKYAIGSYNQINESILKLKKEYKNLTAAERDNAAIGVHILKQITDHDKKLKNLDRTMGVTNRSVGDYQKGWNGLADAMGEMPGLTGTVGDSLQTIGRNLKSFLLSPVLLISTAVIGLVGGLYYLVKNSMEFSKAMSDLSAITGATGSDLEYLKDQAKNLAAEYGKSAVEIVEAMKLVGSAKPELLENVSALSKMTEAVLVLSKATGMELKDATSGLTKIMNQFGLTAYEAGNTINVLAAGSKYGSVEVDYLSEAITRVGTVAKSANLSLEQTTAVMEIFGNKGVVAETAGRGFKSILVDLQGDAKNYTNGMFDLNKAITNNESISNNNIQLQKKFGKEFFGLAQILFQNKEMFNKLTSQITGTNVAFEQMEIASNNLTGDTTKLKGAWDKFLLGLEDGDGILTSITRKVVQLSSSVADALAEWNKSDDEKKQSKIQKDAEMYLKATTSLLATQQDKNKFLKLTISEEEKAYRQKGAQIDQIKKELALMPQSGYGWRKNIEAKKEDINVLAQSIKTSKTYLNLLRDVQKEQNKPASGNGGGNTDVKGKLTLKQQKAAETRANEIKKAKELLNRTIADLMQDGKDKEIAIENAALATRLNDIKGNSTIEIELRKKLKEQSGQTIADIEKKYADESTINELTLQILKAKNAEAGSADNIALKIATLQAESNLEIERINKSKDNEALKAERVLAVKLKFKADSTAITDKSVKDEIEARFYAKDEILKEELLVNEKILNSDKSTFEQKIAAQAKVNSLQTDIFANQLTELEDLHNAGLIKEEDYQKKLAKIKKDQGVLALDELQQQQKKEQDFKKAAFDVGKELINSGFEIYKNISDAKVQTLESERDKELAAAGDNAERKADIEAKFQKKINAEKRKAAIAERLQAIFSIGLNTAIAVTKGLKDLGIPGAIMYGALGAVQLAAVLSKPLPEYWKGTENAPEGLAWVGENGQEAIKRKDGSVSLTSNRRQLTYLQGGEKIYTAGSKETSYYKSILNDKNMPNTSSTVGDNLNLITKNIQNMSLSNNQKESMSDNSLSSLKAAFSDAVSRLFVSEQHWDEKGFTSYLRRSNERIQNMNERFKTGGRG